MNEAADILQPASAETGGARAVDLQRFVSSICRVFPRRTVATPDDAGAFTTGPELWTECNEVHISVTWTYDLARAEQLEKEWKYVAPVKIGGPATGMRGEDFTPGLYLKRGYTITSRGCPNKCWFCSVWKRDGTVRELPIHDGWCVQDDNLLACSEKHIRAVFAMLKRQKRKAVFSGGLEAKLLKPWHVELLADLKPHSFFCAYDTPDDYEPLMAAGKLLKEAGLKSPVARCFLLFGWPKDTFDAAEKRIFQTWEAGFAPMLMLWRDKKGDVSKNWTKFRARWARSSMVAKAYRDRNLPRTFDEPLFAANTMGALNYARR